MIRTNKFIQKPKKYFINLAVILCCVNLLITHAVGAVTDTNFYKINDIVLYNPDGEPCSVASGSSSSGTLTGSTNGEKIWNFLIGKGLTPNQAAGIMGNLIVESASSFSPTVQQIGSPWERGGWGIAQWTGSRRTALKASLDDQPDLYAYYSPDYGSAEAAAANGGRHPGVPEAMNARLLDFELNFLVLDDENLWNQLKTKTTIDDAARFWMIKWERPGDQSETAVQYRIGRSKEMFNTYSGTTAATTTTATASDTTSTDCNYVNVDGTVNNPGGTIRGAFPDLVLAYAWPTYHAAPYINMTNGYKAAIAKAKSEGRYIGGIAHEGIDCGGFVTTLMVDSGFEPNYNAKKGGTDVQKQWLEANWKKVPSTDGSGNAARIDTASLRPGDVAIKSGHTFVYVGQITGFGAVSASASLDERAPMAGKYDPMTNSAYTWYRKG